MKTTLIIGALLFAAGAALGQGMPPGRAPVGLPPGHPPMDMGAMTQGAPALRGSLTVQATSGTVKGAPIGNTTVLVEFYHRNTVMRKSDLILDDKGFGELKDIPLNVPVQPMITITHKGLTQQALGPVLDMLHSQEKVEIRVFEPTDEKPSVSIGMRHVIMDWATDGSGVVVNEMLTVTNPADRAWLGEQHEKTRFTFKLPLPAAAKDVQLLNGFDENAHIHADGVYHAAPLFPGQTQFRVTYVMPADKGKVDLPIQMPEDVGMMMVFAPADEVAIAATGLEGGAPMKMGDHAVRAYRGNGLKAGTTASLAITGLTSSVAPAQVDPGIFTAKNVVVAGGALIALVGVAVLFTKKPKPVPQETGKNRMAKHA